MLLEDFIEPWEDYGDLEWKEHLIWCPSQCSIYFIYKGERYQWYLRWRHSDPWSAAVIYYPHDSEDYIWHQLSDFPEFRDNQLKEAEKRMEQILYDFVTSGENFIDYFKIKQ